MIIILIQMQYLQESPLLISTPFFFFYNLLYDLIYLPVINYQIITQSTQSICNYKQRQYKQYSTNNDYNNKSTMSENLQQKPKTQQQENQQEKQTQQKQQLTPMQKMLKQYRSLCINLISQIRQIQNSEVELQLHDQLTQQVKAENVQKIKQIARQVVQNQRYIGIIGKWSQQPTKMQDQKQNGEQKQAEQKRQPVDKKQQQAQQSKQPQKQQYKLQDLQAKIKKEYGQAYTSPAGEQEVQQRYNELIQQANDSNWTDATESQADDEIWVVDDQIIKAMEEEEDQFGNIQEQEEEHDQHKMEEKGQPKQQIDIEELENQFVVGKQSDHHALFGKHDKFCVSVNGLTKQNILLSGGGDDYLYMYNFPKQQQINKDKCLAPYHIVKHSETVNKIQISYSKQFVFSMTDNEILCTEIKTKQTTKLKSKQNQKLKQKQKKQKKQQKVQEKNEKPEKKKDVKQQQQSQDEEPICNDMVCHHLGDVVAVCSGYELQIFNVKGLKLYQTYYCESMINSMHFTQLGKQIVLACEDYRLRLLTPKTSQIVTVGGIKQHQAQISVMKTKGDIILTGDIDGYIGVTSIKKNALTTLIGVKQTEEVDGAINQLQFAGNYFIAGSSFDHVDWYDLGKCKKLFQGPIQGACSYISWQGNDYPHLYNISTISGYIHIFDWRNPLKEVNKTRAGNTIHQLWCQGHNIAAACQDGHVRVFDIRKLI